MKLILVFMIRGSCRSFVTVTILICLAMISISSVVDAALIYPNTYPGAMGGQGLTMQYDGN